VAEPATVGEPTRRKRHRPRLSDAAAAHVRELIISGQRSAGEFIRPETVAQELDISATPADVRALETLLTGLDTAAELGDYDRVEQMNFEFHRTIYRMADAPKISWLRGASRPAEPLRSRPVTRRMRTAFPSTIELLLANVTAASAAPPKDGSLKWALIPFVWFACPMVFPS